MAGWGGFSEEDLHRLKKDNSSSESQGREQLEEKLENIRKVNINPGTKRTKPREKIKSKTTAPKKNANTKQNTDEKLVKQEKSQETTTDFSEFENENSTPECERHTIESEGREDTKVQKIIVTEIKSAVCENGDDVPEIIQEPERIQAIKLSALQRMQQEQKVIEDQNKLKKAALQQTIKTRFKKTQAEAQVLKVVQKELAHLDSLLSADVAVLRDTIEEATIDYHYAMKRYDHAEAEFIAAKVELHRKTERKEAFTEHLYAIIQQNEQRKANKLEELMAKLNLSEDGLQGENSKPSEHAYRDISTKNSSTDEKENESEVKNLKMGDEKQVCGTDIKGIEENGIENESKERVSTGSE